MRARSAWPRFARRRLVEVVPALGGRVEQAEDREQRGLAAAGRAGNGHILALADLQMNAREGVGFDLVGVEDLGDAFEFDEGTVWCS